MDCSLPGSSGFLRQEYWSSGCHLECQDTGCHFLLQGTSLRDLPDPGIEPASRELASRLFTTEPPVKPHSALWVEAKPSMWAGISWERLRAYFEQVRTNDYDSLWKQRSQRMRKTAF